MREFTSHTNRLSLQKAGAVLLVAAVTAFTATPASAQPQTLIVVDDTDRIVTYTDDSAETETSGVLDLLGGEGEKAGDGIVPEERGSSKFGLNGGGGDRSRVDGGVSEGSNTGLGGGAGLLGDNDSGTKKEQTAGIFAGLMEAIGIGRSASGVDSFDSGIFARELAPKATLFNEQYATLADALTAQLNLGGRTLDEVKLESPSLAAILPANAGVDTAQFSTFAEKVTQVFNRGGIDAKVVERGALYAAELDGLNVPQLSLKDTRGELRIPEESLMYGLVLDRTLAGVVGSSDLLEKFQKEGYGSHKMLAEWDAAIAKGASEVGKELSSTLSSPCHAAFMLTMSGGIGEARLRGLADDCGACVTAGAFSRNEMNRLLDPSYDSQFFDPRDNIPNSPEFIQQPKLVRDLVGTLYPDQIADLETPRNRSLSVGEINRCSGSGERAKATLDSTMPNIMDQLAHQAQGGSSGNLQLPTIGSGGNSNSGSSLGVMDQLRKAAGK